MTRWMHCNHPDERRQSWCFFVMLWVLQTRRNKKLMINGRENIFIHMHSILMLKSATFSCCKQNGMSSFFFKYHFGAVTLVELCTLVGKINKNFVIWIPTKIEYKYKCKWIQGNSSSSRLFINFGLFNNIVQFIKICFWNANYNLSALGIVQSKTYLSFIRVSQVIFFLCVSAFVPRRIAANIDYNFSFR